MWALLEMPELAKSLFAAFKYVAYSFKIKAWNYIIYDAVIDFRIENLKNPTERKLHIN